MKRAAKVKKTQCLSINQVAHTYNPSYLGDGDWEDQG
jgi:hypothetical protein